jgi:ComF family protein
VRARLLELIVPSVCPACDAPRDAGDLLLCPSCARGLERCPSLRGVRTALLYEGTAARLIQRYKFEARRDTLPLLLTPLLDRVSELRFDAIVAVPRHRTRVREQGCDPVHRLARALARASGRPLRTRALRRTRDTPPQTGLDVAARRRNVRGSFTARPGSLWGRSVLLLDDVTTTGATLSEARRALRAAEPRRIAPVALAATPRL